MARSLALHEPAFVPFHELKPRSVSFLPIARGCQAACAFCFSEASRSADRAQHRSHSRRRRAWLDQAAERGAERAVITGGGEPTLLPWPQLLALVRACRERFAKVVLITNGVVLARTPRARRRAARRRTRRARDLRVTTTTKPRTPSHERSRPRRPPSSCRRTCGLAHEARVRAPARRHRQRRRDRRLCSLGERARRRRGLLQGAVCLDDRESVYHSNAANVWSERHQVPLAHVLDWAQRSASWRRCTCRGATGVRRRVDGVECASPRTPSRACSGSASRRRSKLERDGRRLVPRVARGSAQRAVTAFDDFVALSNACRRVAPPRRDADRPRARIAARIDRSTGELRDDPSLRSSARSWCETRGSLLHRGAGARSCAKACVTRSR